MQPLTNSTFRAATKPLTLTLSPSEGERESAAEMSSIPRPHQYPLVAEHDCADVTHGQAVLRQVSHQPCAIEFFDHRIRHPQDTPWPK